MKNLILFYVIICCLSSVSCRIMAQDSKYRKDSIENSMMNKWSRIAKKEYPSDNLKQNISFFANSFWGDKNNAKIIGDGLNNFWKYKFQSNVRSFQGIFSFLVYFDNKGHLQKISFSKNVPIEFISVVQNNFKSLLESISQKDRLIGVFKNKKILFRLNLVWSFTNSQMLKEYIDDGLNALEFDEEGSTLGEVLVTPSNTMSSQI